MNLKKLGAVAAFFSLVGVSGSLFAQSPMVAIKAFSPFYLNGSNSGVKVKTQTPVTCGGNSVTELVLRVPVVTSVTGSGSGYGWGYGDSNLNNGQFIAVSEIASAAKNGYLIELVSLSWSSPVGYVNDFYIHVM
jgi:hypothetical protein